jgi:hypothetical protein
MFVFSNHMFEYHFVSSMELSDLLLTAAPEMLVSFTSVCVR